MSLRETSLTIVVVLTAIGGCNISHYPESESTVATIPKAQMATADEARSTAPVGVLPVKQYSESGNTGASPGITGIYDDSRGRLDVEYGPSAGNWGGIGIPYKDGQFPDPFVFGFEGQADYVQVNYQGQIFAKYSLSGGDGDYALAGLGASVPIDELVFLVSVNSGTKLPAGSFGVFLPLQ